MCKPFLFVFFMVFVLFSSCALLDKDRTNDNTYNNIAFTCFETLRDTVVFDSCSFGESLTMQAVGVNSCLPKSILEYSKKPSSWDKCKNNFFSLKSSSCPISVKHALPKGSQFIVNKIIDKAFGETGRCWLLKAKLLNTDLKGMEFNIPSCRFFDIDQPIWIEEKPLAFKKEFVQKCN